MESGNTKSCQQSGKIKNGKRIKILVIVFKLSSDAEGDMELHLATVIRLTVDANI